MTVALRPRPDRADPRPWSFPSFERSTLANGVTVLACHVPDRPVAEVRIVVDGGLRREPLDLPGLAGVACGAVVEGTEERTADEYALAVESLGARFAVNTDWNHLVGMLSAPASRLREALALGLEALTAPAFRDEDVARVVRNGIGALFTARQMPEDRLRHAFAAAAFMPSGRMAFPSRGTVATLGRVTPDAVRRFWTETMAPRACTVVVVGDLQGAGLDVAVEDTFGCWASTGSASGDVWPVDSPTSERGVNVVDFPGTVQTMLTIGLAWERMPLEDRGALRVATHYLGGFFDSRLMTVLREEKNITYGASAGVSHFGSGSALNAGGSVQTDATVEAVTTMVDELGALAGNDIEPDRFARTVGNLVRTGPTSYTNAGAVASALARLVSEGLPDDYYDRVRQEMAATTAEQAAAAFSRYVDTDRLRVVAVGDASRIVDGLAGLGWGDVTVEPRL